MDAITSDATRFVRHAREKLKLTPAEFAARLGMTRQTVWRYESGDPVPQRIQLAIQALLNEHHRRRRKGKR